MRAKNIDRCLVLGGGGFIGTHIVRALLQRGVAVRILDRNISADNKARFGVFAGDILDFMEGDFCDSSVINRAMQGCCLCIHLVTTTLPSTSNHDKLYDIETNLIGTVRVLEAAKQNHIEKIIYLSSGGTVYGDPHYLPLDEDHPTNPRSSYGIVKLASEKYFQLYNSLYGVTSIVLRLSNPYGPGQNVNRAHGAVSVFLANALKSKTIEIWGDGTVTRDYIYIDDVVSAVIAALDYSGPETIFNIGSGVGIDLNTIVKKIEILLDRKVDVCYKISRKLDVPKNVLDISKARNHLGWNPSVEFSDGIALLSAWYQETSLKSHSFIHE